LVGGSRGWTSRTSSILVLIGFRMRIQDHFSISVNLARYGVLRHLASIRHGRCWPRPARRFVSPSDTVVYIYSILTQPAFSCTVDLPHRELDPVQPFRSVNTGWYPEQSTDLADQPIVLAYLMMADLHRVILTVVIDTQKLQADQADLPRESADLADQPSVGWSH